MTKADHKAELEQAVAQGHGDWQLLQGLESTIGAIFKDSEFRVVYREGEWWALDVEGYLRQKFPSPGPAMDFWELQLGHLSAPSEG